jgi:hypothetical protein
LLSHLCLRVNNGKNTGKVRVAGRRRLCKASNDDITLSSHVYVMRNPAGDEEYTGHVEDHEDGSIP